MQQQLRKCPSLPLRPLYTANSTTATATATATTTASPVSTYISPQNQGTIHQLQLLVTRADPEDTYHEHCKIGEGSAGEVFLASNKTTNRYVVVNKLPITQHNVQAL
eukprot:TRINITY_DN2315_c0_g1_i1.p2 TRINITY_DN2315_c0_g1~~TRINITY_DN2315_c0_g1_i1.p2  ORF type:complete len:107 (-),score=30.21 TRINITY_DN2315_c0_g1_i1:772-1092(-)